MYIVGTSGHIDHGKTSLIRALTNIDCDRLPEEKSREMTVDIGFANIEYPKFGTVSIIDVPGHERFIRNMVVGAWGIDLALLVVAVDDGWMPQTEDHFRVLSLLGIERIVTVLNKIDMADEEMIDYVTAEVQDRLSGSRYADADIVRVSSKTGDGIAELRDVILNNLRRLTHAADAHKPYLFVDRVFASKGYGTIVTGTLKNGTFRDEDAVTLLPLARESRIKKIESHYHELAEGVPSQRTALNLTGVSSDELSRGDIVVKKNFFTGADEAIVKIELLEKKKEIKNNLGIEILIGTTSLKGKLILFSDDAKDTDVFTARIKFDRGWYFYPGQPFIITNPGGYKIIGGGSILMCLDRSVADRRLLRQSLQLFRNYGKEEIIHYMISVRRYAGHAAVIGVFPESEKAINQIVDSLRAQKQIVQVDAFLVEAEFYAAVCALLAKVIAENVGLNLREISDRIGIDAEFCRVLVPIVMERHRIVEKDGRYFAGDAITLDTLSPDRKKTLDVAAQRGKDGLELDKISDEAMKRNARELIKLGFIVSLDGNMLLHRDIYEELKARIMALFEGRDKITIGDAKDATELSRKYIIPLLNRIEGDGLIKRIGDFRIKA